MITAKDIILFSTADWDASYWTNKQHTARQMALQGHRVLFIESIGLRAPNFSGPDFRRIALRLWRGLRAPKLVYPNLWVLSPLAIPFKHSSTIVRRFNQGWLSLCIRLFIIWKRFRSPIVWTYHPFILDTIKNLPHSQLVYHCVDDISAVPGVDSIGFNKEEKRLLPKCTSVFVTSLTLMLKCKDFNKQTYYLPNVVDLEHYPPTTYEKWIKGYRDWANEILSGE